MATDGSCHIFSAFNHPQKPFPASFAPLPEILSLNNQHTTDALQGITGAFLFLGKWQSQSRLYRIEGLLPARMTSEACWLITQAGKLGS